MAWGRGCRTTPKIKKGDYKMKISEAIRKGSQNGPQLLGFQGNDNGSGGTCVYGAMVAGLGYKVPKTIYQEEMPLLYAPCVCPVEKHCQVPYTSGNRVTGFQPMQLFQVMVHLNNDHRWTRERIADWVEQTFERESVPAQEIREFVGLETR
jgi:hypothetical protein